MPIVSPQQLAYLSEVEPTVFALHGPEAAQAVHDTEGYEAKIQILADTALRQGRIRLNGLLPVLVDTKLYYVEQSLDRAYREADAKLSALFGEAS